MALSAVGKCLGAAQEVFVPTSLWIEAPECQAELEVFLARRAVGNFAKAVGVFELGAEGVAGEPLVEECKTRRDLGLGHACRLQSELLAHQVVEVAPCGRGRGGGRLDRPRTLRAHGRRKEEGARDSGYTGY